MSMGDLGFFFREAVQGLTMHRVANLISIICIGLALVFLGMVAAGWYNLQHIADTLQQDAEIVIYLDEDISMQGADMLSHQLTALRGVSRARVVSPEETLSRVESLVGSDIDIMSVLEGYNPFSPSIEVGVDPEAASEVVAFSRGLQGVESVRDNEEILSPLIELTSLVRWAGLVVIGAVLLVTIALASHIVRLGLSARKDDIETLRLLGASESFVCTPFVLEGVLLGVAGAIFATGVAAVVGSRAYQIVHVNLPYLPLADAAGLLGRLSLLIFAVGLAAGTMGSLIALRSA